MFHMKYLYALFKTYLLLYTIEYWVAQLLLNKIPTKK